MGKKDLFWGVWRVFLGEGSSATKEHFSRTHLRERTNPYRPWFIQPFTGHDSVASFDVPEIFNSPRAKPILALPKTGKPDALVSMGGRKISKETSIIRTKGNYSWWCIALGS